jgi:predicted hotdog family 3-hydroxylacyl-ACP dehydratase
VSEPLPQVSELVPHTAPMLLLARVVSHAERATVCGVDVASAELFAGADGRVPAYVGLELMAQCIAVHGGLAARAAGRAPGPGFLVGARSLKLARDSFAPDESLTVSAELVGTSGGLASFSCALFAGAERVAEGVISVFAPESLGEAR